MRSKKNFVLLGLLLILPCAGIKSGLLDIFLQKKVDGQDSDQKLFLPRGIEERQNELKNVESKLAELNVAKKEFFVGIQAQLEKTNQEIDAIKQQLTEDKADKAAFLNKKLTILNEEYQALIDTQLSHKELISTIEQYVVMLKAYLGDSTFVSARVERKSFYTFDDLQTASKKIANHEEKIIHLQEEVANLQTDLENGKRDLQAAKKAYEEKKKEQQDFSSHVLSIKSESETEIRQKGQILDFEQRLYGQVKRLKESQVNVLKWQWSLARMNFFIEQSNLKVLKDDLSYVIKPALRVKATDALQAEQKFQESKQKTVELTKTYSQEIAQLNTQRDKLKAEFEKNSKKFDVPVADRRLLDEWSVQPDTFKGYMSLCQLGYTNDRILLFDRRIDLKTANIVLEDERLRHQEVLVDNIRTWQKITNNMFGTDEEITQEVKKYEAIKSELERKLSTFNDKRNAVTGRLNIQNTALENIRKLTEQLKKQKELFFKDQAKAYDQCISWMGDAQKMITSQIDLNGKLIEEYSSIIVIVTSTLKQINSVISQLSSLGIWKRSVHAISWGGIKNIFPDLETFTIELFNIASSYVSQVSIAGILGSISEWFIQSGSDLFLLILQLFALIIIFLFLRLFLPVFYQRIMLIGSQVKVLRYGSRLVAVAVGFAMEHLLGLYLWGVLFVLVKFELIFPAPTFPHILFYLLGMPYLLYLAHCLVHYFVQFNIEYEYVLLSQPFQKRFTKVFAVFVYSTIVILSLRETLLLISLISYTKSQLPTILLAFYSIIFRTLLIFLIGKEEVLSVIPTHTKVWQWIKFQVNRFYYPLLIGIVALMVISDPYIGGYGNLVSYLMWSLIWTALLIRVLFLTHTYLKKVSSYVFFSTEDDTLKERFGNAKTWYGVFVIFIFIVAVVGGLLICAWIWGRPIALKDIGDLFYKEIFPVGVGPDKKSITALSFLQLFAFILGGFFVSFALNRFVMRKIFDLLLIDAGVQNTITSITRYLIVITAIIVGFQSVRLGNFLISIGVLLAGAAWIVQEPIRDFASYFILLVQRPIKIGDYIVLDQETQGVVRQITPRSVILRRKNSFSIIVPNSQVTNKSILNWNYTRNFISLNDIFLTVPYSMDPKHVADVIIAVLEKNQDVLKSPQPIVRLNRFADNGYVFLIRGFVSAINTLMQWDIASDIRFALVQAFKNEGIKLATPIRIVKVMKPDDTSQISTHKND